MREARDGLILDSVTQAFLALLLALPALPAAAAGEYKAPQKARSAPVTAVPAVLAAPTISPVLPSPGLLAAPASPLAPALPAAAVPPAAAEAEAPAAASPQGVSGAAEAEPQDPRARRALADARSAAEYIRGVMGARAPTESEREALLVDFLDSRDIPARSDRARELRRALGVKEKSRAEKLAEANGVTVEQVLSAARARGVDDAAVGESEWAAQVNHELLKRAMDRAVAPYPRTPQGEFMRTLASVMTAKSGKSIEEVTRAGAFVYADFQGSGPPLRVSAGRDPDPTRPSMVFYVTRREGRWDIAGYRQNRRHGASDGELISRLKKWLVAGGIPASDLTP